MTDNGLEVLESVRPLDLMDDQLVTFARALSRLLGWIYTLSWSASFYPQPLMNWRRKATHGLSIEFPFLNVVGFTCYTISTTTLFYSPTIKRQYAARHPLAPVPTVRFNDVAYAIHAFVLVAATYSQFFPRLWRFDVQERQKTSRVILAIAMLCAIGVAVVAVVVVFQNGVSDQDPSMWAWIDVISAIGYVKLVVTFFKYIPQVWLNYKRQSTRGWSIGQILLDANGGILSTLQLIIDATVQHDWKDVTHNPVKLGLGYISVCFDIIFITQHYFLYNDRGGQGNDAKDDTVHQPLLANQ